MCGLFGMTLPHRYPDHLLERAEAVLHLGTLAESRGLDAAGLAVRGRDGRWVRTRTLGPFQRLARQPGMHARLDRAVTVLGHTRAATQGAVTLANTSPAAVGNGLLCTHNGDVDTTTIPWRPEPLPAGGTDSAALFGAIATAHRRRVDTDRIARILSAVHGRAALAWVDTSRPGGRVWLARAGLSPLTVGHDVDGGLWWASNPAWLRDLTRAFDLPFTRTETVAEGSLLVADPLTHTVRLQLRREFKPTVRLVDQRATRHAVWRGFTGPDRAQDEARSRHRLAPPPRTATRP